MLVEGSGSGVDELVDSPVRFVERLNFSQYLMSVKISMTDMISNDVF